MTTPRYSLPSTLSDARRVPVLDGIRALACVWVIALHCVSLLGSFWIRPEIDVHRLDADALRTLLAEPLLRVLVKGELGVDVFFVLSGFLIVGMLLRERSTSGTIRPGRFLVGRFLRLYPSWLAAILLFAVFSRETLASLPWNLVYLNNYLPTYDQFMLHGWSLAVEWQFYALLPLALLLASRIRLSWVLALAALWALSLVSRFAVVQANGLHLDLAMNPGLGREACARFNETLYSRLPMCGAGLLAGGIAAWWHRRGSAERFFRDRGRISASLVVLSIAVIAAILQPSPVAPRDPAADTATLVYLAIYKHLFTAAVSFLLVGLLVGHPLLELPRRILAARVWQPLALLSYGAYLLHPLFIKALYLHAPPVSPGPGAIVAIAGGAIAVSFLAAIPLYLFVELPARTFAARRRAAPEPQTLEVIA